MLGVCRQLQTDAVRAALNEYTSKRKIEEREAFGHGSLLLPSKVTFCILFVYAANTNEASESRQD